MSRGTAPSQTFVLGRSLHEIAFREFVCVLGVFSEAVHAAPAVAAQHGRPQDPLDCSTTLLAASACPALEAWVGQTQVLLRSQGLTYAGWPGCVRWEPHPVRLPFMGCCWLFWCVVMQKRM